MYNTRMMKFVLGKLQNKMSGRNPFDRTPFEAEWMNEMMGRFARFIRLNAFSSKAVIKTVHGRSSDLFLLPGAFPEADFQWLLVVCLQPIMKLTAAGLFRICT